MSTVLSLVIDNGSTVEQKAEKAYDVVKSNLTSVDYALSESGSNASRW